MKVILNDITENDGIVEEELLSQISQIFRYKRRFLFKIYSSLIPRVESNFRQILSNFSFISDQIFDKIVFTPIFNRMFAKTKKNYIFLILFILLVYSFVLCMSSGINLLNWYFQ